MNYFLVQPTHFSWRKSSNTMKLLTKNNLHVQNLSPSIAQGSPSWFIITSLCHCPPMLSFAWWFYFYFEHILPPSLFCNFCLNCSYCLFYPFIIFFISPIFLFFCFSPLPSPLPRPRPPSFLSFQPHQSPQPPLKTLSAATPAPPPCW